MCAARNDSPENIGKYRIESILGMGSMGVVYKAYDPHIDRPVAIKLLQGHLLQSEKCQDFVQRFHQEARAAARCLHANIVTVFDFGMIDGLPFIVMEFVEGVDLRTKIQCDAPFSLNITLHICRQVLEAMAYAHSRGVIHRDIKPSNILLRENGSLKVSDFGVARLDSSNLTHTGYLMGTPNYMAPDALLGMPAEKSWDLYSIGVLMFELLTKQIPQKGIPLPEALIPLEKKPSLSSEQLHMVQSVLLHALDPNPMVRIASAESFLRELRKIPVENANPKEVESLVTKADITLAAQSTVQPRLPRPISSSGRWSPEIIKNLETALTRHIGPMARFLVDKSARETQRLDELCFSLAQQIPTEKERQEFLRELDNSGIFSQWIFQLPSHSHSRPTSDARQGAPSQEVPSHRIESSQNSKSASVITLDDLQKVSGILAFYVGPMAIRLVNRVASQCTSLEDLQNRVAQYIPNTKERQEFFVKLEKINK